MQPRSESLIYVFLEKHCAPPYIDSFAQQHGGDLKIKGCNMLQRHAGKLMIGPCFTLCKITLK